MDTLPPTCQHSKLGCNYTLSPPGDATGARFLVSLPPSVCTKVQIKSPVSKDSTNFARCCLTTKINKSFFPNLLFFKITFYFYIIFIKDYIKSCMKINAHQTVTCPLHTLYVFFIFISYHIIFQVKDK